MTLGALLTGCAGLEQTVKNDDTHDSTFSQTDSNDSDNVTYSKRTPASRMSSPDITPEKSLYKTILSESDPAYQTTLWDEFTNQFSLTQQNAGQFEGYVSFYRDNTQHLELVSERAKPYMHYILNEVKKRQMPYEIALLPMIESGFQPEARSHMSAAGLWQFMPGTGDLYNLDQNWWYDGRQDVVKSTHAALDYLQKLYQLNNNDWLLALASYNAGFGNIQKAVKKYQDKNPSSLATFWNVRNDLPKETQDYVPKLLAVSHSINHYKDFNLALEPINNRQFFSEVRLTKPISLTKVAELSQVSNEVVSQLNPGYLRPTTPPTGPHNILLPSKNAALFQAAIAQDASLFNIEWAQHTVASGDSLKSIATKYSVSEKAISEINQLKNARVTAGTHLAIPLPSQYAEVFHKQRTEPASSKQTTYAGLKTIHTVASGETIWSIARKYGTQTNNLASWNNLNLKNGLKAGQKLEIRSNPLSYQVKHTVKKNETLASLAKQYNVSTIELSQWNKLSVLKALKPGMQLSIVQTKQPASQSSIAQSISKPTKQASGVNAKQTNKVNETKTLAATQPVKVATNTQAKPATTKDKRYVVKSGDNLWNIAQAHRVSVQQIALYNKFTLNTPLKPGQVIKIPLQVSSLIQYSAMLYV
jgi:membrane-bound lytic murein transglycosylase D